MDLQVEHDEGRQRFVVEVAGEEAVIEYERPDEWTMNIHRTFVPPAARGRGVAGELARAALEHAKEEGWVVVPTCPYVARFIDEHPEYEALT